jgi:hypothetical protein
MGKLYITEYVAQPIIANGQMGGMALEPGIRNGSGPITFTTHVESTAFGSTTKFIRVHTDAICSLQIGAAPVATTSDTRMAANTTEYFAVLPGHILSAVSNT